MIESQLIGRPVSELEALLGTPVDVPERPPEGDPEYGLRRYLEFPERGLAILIDWDDVVECVQVFGGVSDDGNQRYEGRLPHGLLFSSTRAEVRSAMGTPVASRDGNFNISPLKARPWDWFAWDGLKAHFEYNDAADGVRMVSAMPLPSE